MLKIDKKKPKQLKTEIVTITPEIATAWLEQNTHNRKMTPRIVSKYADDMTNGAWELTGDAIRFAEDGRLLDGQHRLAACLRAQVPFVSVVVYGLQSEVQDIIDTGKSRTAGDMLKLRGLVNANHTAATCRLLISYKAQLTYSQGNRHSHTSIRDALERHPNITKSVTQCLGLPRGMPQAAFSFVHYVATTFLKAADDANEMIDVLKTGVPSYDGDPIHALRDKLLLADPKPSFDVAANTVFRAWNAYCQRDTLRISWQKRPIDIDGLDRNLL